VKLSKVISVCRNKLNAMMKILKYMFTLSNQTGHFIKKHKNNQKIRKSSDTVRLDKINRIITIEFGSKFHSSSIVSLYQNRLPFFISILLRVIIKYPLFWFFKYLTNFLLDVFVKLIFLKKANNFSFYFKYF
jgi:hypothetical protein